MLSPLSCIAIIITLYKMRIGIKQLFIWSLAIVYFFHFICPLWTVKAIEPNPTKLFAIQHWMPIEYITWGREGYPMTKIIHGLPTQPIFYCRFYLTITPSDSYTQGLDMVYFVLDDQGSIWLDPDGKFNNCLYDPSRDPENPWYVAGTCQQSNRLEGKIRYSIDPKPDNNTQGPYSIDKILSGETVVVQIKGRRFLLGILDRTDFAENTITDMNDWDIKQPLISFLPTEKHVDNQIGNETFDPFEWMYRLTSLHSTVEAGDRRLSPVNVPGANHVYEPNSIVQPGDLDIGFPLVSFQTNEKHYQGDKSINDFTVSRRHGFDFFYDFIYLDFDEDSFVSPGEKRLTPVNVSLNPVTGSLRDFGLTKQDGLILAEISETNREVDFVLETNYYDLDSALRLVVKALSNTSQIPQSITSLGTALHLPDNQLQMISFMQNILPHWTGFLGFEWFLDNGVNNKIASQSLHFPLACNLSDDFYEKGESEEIWGQYSRTGDLDYQSTLHPLPANVRYYDLSGSGFGASVPFYRDVDLSHTVSSGDERLINVELARDASISQYPMGSIVSANDQDSGLILQDIPSHFRFVDVNPDLSLSNNGSYDVREPIYKKGLLSLHDGYVEAGDFRITSIQIGSTSYAPGTYVAPSVFYFHESKVWGFSTGLSGDFRLIDVPIIPGKSSSRISEKPEWKVEQTTTLDIQIETLKKGEKLIVLVDGSTKRSNMEKDLMIRKDIEGPYSGVVTITITPYTSSYSEKGLDYPLTILLLIDTGGLPIPIQNYRDKVLESMFFEPIYSRQIEKYESLLPVTFHPDRIDLLEQFVMPEDLEVLPSKNSISQYDLRFPNLWAKIKDKDNEEDVNDPSQIIAPNSDSIFIANFNCLGAGIDYLCTTYGYLSDKPGVLQFFIVQVNRNQSYTIWLWKDIEPKGILNWGDTLSNVPLIIQESPKWTNNDCSIKFKIDKWDLLGTNAITRHDFLGIFNGEEHELIIDEKKIVLSSGGVECFGVNAKLETFGTLSKSDPGGDFPLVALPQFSDQELNLLVYTTSVLFDYKNSIQHPPYFVESFHRSIQYRGACKVRAPRIEDVNVTNVTVVDHSLSYSQINYTAGDLALSPLKDIQLTAPYQPMITSLEQDFVVYPGGNMHANRSLPEPLLGYEGLPTISRERLPTTKYRKLGTEESPLTDYSFFFMVQAKSGEFIRFDPEAPKWLRIEKVVVEGPIKMPKIIQWEKGSVLPEIGYPVLYDYSGKLIIDRENSHWYQSKGDNWTGRIGFGKDEYYAPVSKQNPLLERTQVLNYKGFPYVFKIPEITPIQAGRLHITIYLSDGTITELGDCCSSEPKTGVMAHGIKIDQLPQSIVPGEPTTLKPILRAWEGDKKVATEYCNNAYVVLWQDRGALPESGKKTYYHEMGAGDGRLQGYRSILSDHNQDGKVSFSDYETEIMGTFDLASNTWSGGTFDARTFNTENGVYPMALSLENGSQTRLYGVDFNEDHLISSGEECPLYFSAYQFYDDNNDRAFTPLYKERSHEVFLSGEAKISLGSKEDLIIQSSPVPLTAGFTPEKVSPFLPLTLEISDSEGSPIDLGIGIFDLKGENRIKPEIVQSYLFDDTPFEPLPQYYWIRTDLHNTGEGFDCNDKMYGKPGQVFNPIRIDFSESKVGKYHFYGFCANDEGVFEVRVYTPDRLHVGKTWIIVESPQINYEVSAEGSSLFGPDFILTAGINRIYRIDASITDAMGNLVRTGRAIPYTTKPASFDLPLLLSLPPPAYFLHIAYPGSLSLKELDASHLTSLRGFGREGLVYYNTTNIQYENGLFSKTATIEPNTSMTLHQGWGLGCIYNQPRDSLYLFPDVNQDGGLTKQDCLVISEQGKVSFLLLAEDVCQVGMVVGVNDFSDSAIFSDVAGYPPSFTDSPCTIRGRFRGYGNQTMGSSLADQIFALDWDAFALQQLTCSFPVALFFTSSSGIEMGTELLNPNNYDLIYGVSNHIVVHLTPADPRDTPIQEGTLFLKGNHSENFIYGNLRMEEGICKTYLTYTPTGIGEQVANLFYQMKNRYYKTERPLLEAPVQYILDLHRPIDSIRALQIFFPAGSVLVPGVENRLLVQVKEKGSGALVENAEVILIHEDLRQVLNTDAKGLVEFVFTPKVGQQISLQASKDAFLPDQMTLW